MVNRIHTKQTKKTFSGIQASGIQASGIRASKIRASKIQRQNTEQDSSNGSHLGNLANKYAIQFNNMFANVTNAKSGCRSCRGTF